MIDLLRTILEQASAHVALVLVCVLLAAAMDAALGIGAILPGETGIVLAAIALSDRAELIALAVATAAVGAFIGDHIGFAVGRGLGSQLGDTRVIRRLGIHRWNTARQYVSGRFWTIILARLLPGIRTFVAAAAGSSTMPYSRFAAACGIASVLWATLWVVGGATIGTALLDAVEHYTLPTLTVLAVVVASRLFARRRKKVHL
ncbi:DedA family protein [Propionimicrobium sp. PCR01-08-3]|uniref:DedA family protein n=1 Tax=Propionimicrobium sp. PCR01-08-3 TaxID=3052086 RepID=UPI00255CC456|nr:DedA family protein [Propionimicrobium sp. PCR01-08-3]WIY82242.1 DedA family protein [Propionimicrobium sp. PCR01-08-3]